jgi:hypothetical protein
MVSYVAGTERGNRLAIQVWSHSLAARQPWRTIMNLYNTANSAKLARRLLVLAALVGAAGAAQAADFGAVAGNGATATSVTASRANRDPYLDGARISNRDGYIPDPSRTDSAAV